MNNVDYLVSTEDGDILIEKDSKRITDNIVDQLIAYRKQLELTQQDIADATGIKRANIARLELKKNEASLDSLVRYAKSMGLDLFIELVGIQENSARNEI
ncbi:MAG: helix-turn-helix transcriptional regulator [Roseburia sp.]|nr:helix-turn-helix transcriptional regulator [Roseburia sp.]